MPKRPRDNPIKVNANKDILQRKEKSSDLRIEMWEMSNGFGFEN
uniref:Uncharacterized protein n=1 Tax=uncultured Flavobacteriia bacterium TaxID=212695 RepID=H6RFU9_9BACT|nr:hypothetical protein VIS_S3CCB20009 [uncultured Flavobacteriia bacterium]